MPGFRMPRFPMPHFPLRHLPRAFNRIAVAAVVALGLGAGGATVFVQSSVAQNAAPAAPVAPAVRVPTSKAEITLSFAPVVKSVVPAVVNVYASRIVAQPSSPFGDDPLFRRFFGGGDGLRGPTRQRQLQSLGSGVIVDPSGIIVTNNHVIKDADAVRVALADRREFDADIVLKDEKTDLAVLRIRGAQGTFPALTLGDSDKLEVGDIVLAVGNPFGVGQTVTQGIVSALARTQVGITDYQFFIQTDAAINPGNSGGALVDMNGNVVGINTAIFSRSGGSIGIGFAIPANMVRQVVDAARQGGVIRRPWLGATLQTVTADIADGLGLDRPEGAIVTAVVAGSPAAKAGLEVGDLVVSVDGVEIDDPDSFGYRFATKPLGGTVALGIRRGEETLSLSVALVQAPEVPARDARDLDGVSPFAGATVMNLSPAVNDELRLPGDRKGVAVSRVAANSIAAQVGFVAGDIVLEVNGTAVDTTAQLAKLTAQRAPVWRIAVEREGRVLQIALRG